MKKFIRYIYYIIVILLFRIVQLFPYKAAVNFGGKLGQFAYYLIKEAREITLDNLRKAYPEKKENEIRILAKKIFENQGKNAFEVFYYPKLNGEDLGRLVKLENFSILTGPVNNGKGVIMASAHAGNWELMGAAMATAGLPLNVIAKRVYIEKLNDMLLNFRTSKGLRIIFRTDSDSARKMLKALKNKEVLTLIIDQDTEVPGVFVDFFKRPAWTPSGLATLAVKTGSPVVLALDVRNSDDTHSPSIKPVEIKITGDVEKDIFENTQKITSMIEEHIRQYPEQWVWMHKRWKTQPKNQEAFTGSRVD